MGQAAYRQATHILRFVVTALETPRKLVPTQRYRACDLGTQGKWISQPLIARTTQAGPSTACTKYVCPVFLVDRPAIHVTP